MKDRVALLENELRLNQEYATSPDVDERQRAEDARSRLAAIVTSCDDAIIGKTLDGTITTWNKSAEQIYGYSEAEAVGKSIRTIVPPDCMQGLGVILDKVRRGEHVEHYETVRVAKDGRRIDMSVTISPILDASGTVIGASAIARDITGSKQARDALAKAHGMVNTLLDQAFIGIGFLDLELRFILVNDKLAEINGISAEAHIGKLSRDIVPSLVPTAQKVISQILATGEPVKNYEFSGDIATSPGVVRFWNESWYPMRDSSGSIDGFGVIVEEITERKRYEEALRESEEKFRTLAETTSAGIVLFRDDKYIYVNPVIEKTLGYSKDELLAMNFWDIIHPDYRELVRSRGLSRLQGSTVSSPYELKIQTKGSETHWADFSAGVINYQGQPTVIATIFIITERKRAEEALRKSEEKYRELVENANSIIVRWDMRGNFTFFNEFAEKFFGYPKDEILGKSIIGTIVPSTESSGRDLAVMVEDIKRDPEKYTTNVNENICRDGGRVWVSWTNKAILDAHGNVAEILSVGNDITKLKNAEEALRASRARLESISLAVPAGIGVTVNRVITEVNDKLCEMLGYSREELIGKNARMVYPSDEEFEHAGLEGYGHKSMTGTGTVETRWLRKDGRIIDILMSTMQIEPGNVALGVTFAALDITDRKRAEDELKSTKMQADLYVDLMCHDISNMNQVGLGFLEMALDMLDLDEIGREMLLKPRSAFENSSRLIDNVRKLQKARSGEYQDRKMDVGDVVCKVRDYYSKQYGPSVTINYMMKTGYLVKANELLFDLFTNLVGNAIKHSRGHPLIDISVEPTSKNGHGYYKVSIDDRGPGIPDELKAVIFDRKLTGDIKSKGSGIGLLMVKILVDGFGGRVWVEDRVLEDHTKGARFVVMLPAVEK